MTKIAVAVVENGNGEFLVGHRPDGAALAGYAEFPGGKIEPGESAGDAAVRECREETGLDVEVVKVLTEVSHEYDHGVLRLYFFRCRPIGNGPPPSGSFTWIGRDALALLEFPAANRTIVEQLLGRS